ncbi:hypothetical protein [uncultured Legionella sp.]|uniref:hypothetical protein n=1 Tax=uncultured Legionella sp. TaxID=210934 RepID=UPI00260A0BB2|nr:hypothetical protein [uncultured Legionella sp.]
MILTAVVIRAAAEQSRWFGIIALIAFQITLFRVERNKTIVSTNNIPYDMNQLQQMFMDFYFSFNLIFSEGLLCVTFSIPYLFVLKRRSFIQHPTDGS